MLKKRKKVVARSSPQEKKNEALRLLESLQLSRTKPRLEILKSFLGGHHILSAEDIFDQVREFGFDLTTVYRTLTVFEEKGLIARIQLADGITRFELTYNSHHHHHIICRACKKIEIIQECVGEQLNQVGTRLGFSDVQHALEFYGLCPTCTPPAPAASSGRQPKPSARARSTR